jgi:hypothetical protein
MVGMCGEGVCGSDEWVVSELLPFNRTRKARLLVAPVLDLLSENSLIHLRKLTVTGAFGMLFTWQLTLGK